MSHVGGGGRRGSRISSVDSEKQRELNAQAPKVEHLGRRIAGLFKPYRGSIAVMLLLVLGSSTLAVVPPLVTQHIFDDALFPEQGGPYMRLLAWLVALMIGLFLASALLSIFQTMLTARVGNRVMGDLRVSLFTKLQGMDLAFFTRTRTGTIQSRLQNDVGGVASVLSNTVSSVVGNTVTVLSALVAMLLLSWQLTIVAVIIMPFLVIMQRRIGAVRARIAAATQESLSEMTAITGEALSVSGMLLAKTFSRQPAEITRYSDENDRQVHLQVRQTMSGQLFFAIVNVCMSAIPAVIYLVAGWIITQTGGPQMQVLTAGTIVAFTTVQSRLLFPLMGLMRIALDLQTSGALFARIFEYLDLKPQVYDRPNARPAPRVGERDTASPVIEFDDVSFRYPDQGHDSKPTLDRLSFTVQPGEFVAFVGASGSGKTTTGYLIPRLYDASAGTVRFAGEDVRELEGDSLMNQIGFVTQQPYLFHASIADNLRYGKPDATDNELREAAKLANIADTIDRFDDGYDTVVGERGYRLSGGEQQRIAIARVLLKNPPVLVLDEATSALDTVSERHVQDALEGARAGRTTIAIAHRLSTIVDADRIFVMDRGRIIERGTHDQLLERRGTYSTLFSRQHSGTNE